MSSSTLPPSALEQARSASQEEIVKTAETNESNNVVARVKLILSQDRGVLNFENYTPSSGHVNRMKSLARTAPELYDSPHITPRSKWFSHEKWNQNSQMPPYHVHFRQELQDVVRYLFDAYNNNSNHHHPNNNKSTMMIQNAHSLFVGSMRGLNGHVSIEEYACFPLYVDTFPNVDIACLYKDHKQLHKSEKAVQKTLSSLLEEEEKSSEKASRQAILSSLQVVLDFDDRLMAHLGEEEEIVVPMSLTDKDIWF
jgi:hypothetical protein